VRGVCIASNTGGAGRVPGEDEDSPRGMPPGVLCWNSVGLGGVSCPDPGGRMIGAELPLIAIKVSAVGVTCIA